MTFDPPASITEAVYRAIRGDLLACRDRPGEKLRIAVLAARHRSSPGAVREALSRLTAEGLVTAEPQRGFQAAPISYEELSDLTVARIEVECICLRMAVSDGDVAWEEGLLAALHRLSCTPMRPPDGQDRLGDDWSTAHAAFHEALASGCPSRTLLQVRRQLYAQSERYRQLSIPLAEVKRDLDSEHRALAEAALDRDVLRAVQAMKVHLEETSRILLKAISAIRSAA